MHTAMQNDGKDKLLPSELVADSRHLPRHWCIIGTLPCALLDREVRLHTDIDAHTMPIEAKRNTPKPPLLREFVVVPLIDISCNPPF